MSVSTTMSNPTAGSALPVILSGARAALLRVRQFVRAYRNRSSAAVLAGFDDRMLADIGLTRSDVRDAFGAPLWHDPTNLLRTRALERRLSRHGISFGLADQCVAAPPLAPKQELAGPRTNRPARFTV